MNQNILIETVTRLVSPPKGILAIDESTTTCNKRFEILGVPTTEEKRREYRELLITTPGMEQYISGYILFDETIRQSTKNGKSFTSVLQEKGIDVGIKVDAGLVEFSENPLEKVTQGLDGLENRLEEYKGMGATFAKWRMAYLIGENIPSEACMRENAVAVAKYAVLCQELNIVPIVEPEILYDGDHSIEKCFTVTAKNLDILFAELRNANVFFPGMILKTSMVLAGKNAREKSTSSDVAMMTVKCLNDHVPGHIGGIVFLSGGQSGEDAALNLNAMHKNIPLPWPLTFSYARAIQNNALESWAKNPTDIKNAQALLLERAKIDSLASEGKYKNKIV